jgi:hypothetical protein
LTAGLRRCLRCSAQDELVAVVRLPPVKLYKVFKNKDIDSDFWR